MARDERFGIGKRIDELLLSALEQLREASYSSGSGKITLLGKILQSTDLLRFFFQLAWEGQILQQRQYILLAENTESLGKMVGGWRKGLIAKTPPQENKSVSGERKE